MANNIQELNFEEILTLIQGQLMEHMYSEEYYEKYKGVKLVLSNEQQFMKLKDKDPNAIYIVVRFGSADVMFGQTVLPATIIVLAQQNRAELAYNLMYEYAQRYNLVRANDNTIRQVYESPSMSGNFNEVYEGFRSVVTVSSAFVIGKNSNEYKVYYYYTNENGVNLAEEVPQISSAFGFVGTPDTQVFYNSQDYVRTVIGFGAVTLGFTMFVLTDNRLTNDVLSVLGEVKEDGEKRYVFDGEGEVYKLDGVNSEAINNAFPQFSTYSKKQLGNVSVIDSTNGNVWVFDKKMNGTNTWKVDRRLESVVAESVIGTEDNTVNKKFRLGVVYKDGKHARIRDYKLTNANGAQDVGEIPTLSIVFTE